jgi:hypothetical protein
LKDRAIEVERDSGHWVGLSADELVQMKGVEVMAGG